MLTHACLWSAEEVKPFDVYVCWVYQQGPIEKDLKINKQDGRRDSPIYSGFRTNRRFSPMVSGPIRGKCIEISVTRNLCSGKVNDVAIHVKIGLEAIRNVIHVLGARLLTEMLLQMNPVFWKSFIFAGNSSIRWQFSANAIHTNCTTTRFCVQMSFARNVLVFCRIGQHRAIVNSAVRYTWFGRCTMHKINSQNMNSHTHTPSSA